jgi:nucleotide-binding universal stress UspA family protein
VYKHILVAIDGSETSVLALDAALQIAREADAELQPVYIIDAPLMAYDAPGYDPSILRDALIKEGTRVTNEALGKMHLQKLEALRGSPKSTCMATALHNACWLRRTS